ncbi:MAG: hypothetical protein A3E88_04965 [Legionellales bacterium RIFCSPHIGHO2_12_FULL_35_11]|nr:MAG: hypothetical protein A3E88_04965 [Legionellales bacterium RIFCSPHIGHO2_12_FULL_35_11]
MQIIVNDVISEMPSNSLFLASQSDFIINILSCFEYDRNFPPVAKLLQKFHKLSGEWLVISPIHWQATHNDALLLRVGHEFLLSESQGEAWFMELEKFIFGEDIKVHYHNPYTWLIQVKDHLSINSKSVYQLLNKSIMTALEKLDNSMFWAKFMTESQMFLSNNYLNKKLPIPINGFWVWGDGKLNTPTTKKIVVCDEDSSRIAKIISKNIVDSSSIKKFNRQDIVISQNANILNKISNKLINKHQSWYWNNIAYKIRHEMWFKRIFS